ncbi:hypothetical protein B4N89_24375 [Embleya scabrispora]|uniref:Secreted protein n=1 Tax=Embleya scabrispora TaxID=159449 RepID=A0A1T3P3H8_9ACTN|nr:hypothetical protein [Embleya scabrispora]OPC83658.1 hypothetical protein B4N89_24375 [Embleya scabrispora]
MRRIITSISVWLAVTAVAVALSWWGVRSVLRETVFEPPRPPSPVAGDVPPPSVSTPPPTPSAPPTSEAPDLISAVNRTPPPTSPSPPPTTIPPTTKAPPAAPPAQLREQPPAAAVQSFEVRGGRASFRYQATTATLIAASPNPGWAVKVWPGDRWIRVDFVRHGQTSSVFVVWNGHDPMASTYED